MTEREPSPMPEPTLVDYFICWLFGWRVDGENAAETKEA